MDNEEVGDLDPVAAVDRVVLQEDTKLYRARVILAVLTGGVYDFKKTVIVLSRSTLPVYGEDDSHIGYASAYVEGVRILADITIDYACGERLLIETKSVRLFAWPLGACVIDPASSAHGEPLDLQAPLAVTRFSLVGVQLMRKAPVDARLGRPAVGEPVF